MEKEELQQIINATAQAVATPLLERIKSLESRLKAVEPPSEEEVLAEMRPQWEAMAARRQGGVI